MFALARRLSLHQAIVVDDFSEHAPALRSELLGFPHWRPMTQTTPGPTPGTFSSRPRWSHQSGITTGHLDDRHDELPHTARFTAELLANAAALCALTAAGDHRGLRMDVNAMAYGVGGRLAPHDDHGHGKGRRVAWILYLTPPGDDWTAGDGGALRLISHEASECVYPMFNRFVAFRVDPQSTHEIQEVLRATDWKSCRLSLSGWLAR